MKDHWPSLKVALFSSTNYERPLLLEHCRKAGVEAVETEAKASGAHLQWGKARDLLWEPILEGACVGSCHPVFSALSRKADLARCLGARGCPLPAVDAGFAVPKTIVIDLDDSDSDCESEGGTDEEDVEQCTAGKVNSAAGPGDGGAAGRPSSPFGRLTRPSRDGRLPCVRRAMRSAPPECLWVLKASDSNRGEDILTVRGDEQGATAVEDTVEQGRGKGCWVLQRYVEGLLLLGGRKFHLRVHAVAAGSLSVAVHCQSRVRRAALPFSASLDSLSDPLVHTTNAPEQRQMHTDPGAGSLLLSEAAELLVREATGSCGAAEAVDGPLDAGTLLVHLEDPEDLVQRLQDNIHSAVRHVFEAASGSRLGFFPLPNCFQLYGLDFLVDRHLRLHLLEVNSDPSMAGFGQRLRPEACQLLGDTLYVGLRMAAAGGRGSGATSFQPLVWPQGFTEVMSLPAAAAGGGRVIRRLLLQCGLLARGRYSSAPGGEDTPLSSRPPMLASVSPRSFGGAAASQVLERSTGMSLSDCGGRSPLVRLQWSAHKDIRWERVLDGTVAANHFLVRQVLASASAAPQLFNLISRLLVDSASHIGTEIGLGGSQRHPMPMTLAVTPGVNREEWQARVEDAVVHSQGDRAHPQLHLWHVRPPRRPRSSVCWDSHAIGCRTVAWKDALDAVFGDPEPRPPPTMDDMDGRHHLVPRSWVLQRAVPPPQTGSPSMELPEELFSGSEPLVLRCFLLVAGACRGFLHREMEICTRDGPSRGTDNQGSGTASRKWARPAAGSRVLQTAQEAAATMMAAACSSSAQSGFMPLRNCFELFRVSFSVDESWNSWLMSCETVPDTAGDAETPEWLVSDALRTALPLVGIDEAGIQVPVSSSEPRPESQCDGRPDDGGSFVQVFCREY